MTPEFCVCIVNNAHWWLKDYGNDHGTPRLYWSSDPTEAQRFTRHDTAVALAQIVKHTHPGINVRLMEFPREVRHDTTA
jgi:hypothetical protein